MQQAPVAQAPALQQQQNSYGGLPGHHIGGFGNQAFMQPTFQHAPMSQVAQGKQAAQDAVPAFDEAAFEQAFVQAEQEAQVDIDMRDVSNGFEAARDQIHGDASSEQEKAKNAASYHEQLMALEEQNRERLRKAREERAQIDYRDELALLEERNKERLRWAREEQQQASEAEARRLGETDPLLARLRETRPGV